VGKVNNVEARRRKEIKGEVESDKDYAQRQLFETEVVQRELCDAAVAVYREGIAPDAVGSGSQHNDSVR